MIRECRDFIWEVRQVYAVSIAKAHKRIGWRDPDDVELLALALHFKVPLWSNDNDFEGCGAERERRRSC